MAMQHAPPQWLSADESDLWRTLISVADRLITVFDQDLQTMTDLRWHEYGLLVHISESPGAEVRLAELAASLLFATSRVNRTLDSLTERGWTWRASRSDGHWVGLTDSGRERLASAAPLHLESVRRRVFDRLDEDLQPVLKALHALEAGLEDSVAGPG